MSRDLRPVDVSSNPQFQRDAAALHALGVRALAELLAEIAMEMDPLRREWLFDRLAAYRGISKEALAITGGNTFPAIPLRVVPKCETME